MPVRNAPRRGHSRPADGQVKIQFDGTWTDNDPRANGQERFFNAREAREFWSILVHRAVIQTMDSTYDPFTHYTQGAYNALAGGDVLNPGKVVATLTGDDTIASTLNPIPTDTEFDAFDDIKLHLSEGTWLTAKSTVGTTLVQPSQSYAITKVPTVLGTNYITLYNPSGFDKGTTALGTLDNTGRPADDGFITISATDFFANFQTGYRN